MAKDDQKSTSTPAQATATVAAAPAGPRITFSAPYVSTREEGAKVKATKTQPVATGIIEGLFPAPLTRLCINEVKLTLNKASRDLVVYLPAGGFGFNSTKHVGPRMVPLATPIMVAGREVTHQDDPEAVKECDKLNTAIKEAWVSMAGIPEAQRWGKTVPLVIR